MNLEIVDCWVTHQPPWVPGPIARFHDKRAGTIPNAALIAVVDDDEWVRKSMERLIKSAGFRTQAFASAEDFVASGKPDDVACVILDLRLPGMSGLDLQARLAADHNPVPIVFVSAHDEQSSRSAALASGAIAFLAKPVNDKSLLDAIYQALK
jgi:FixJ family two-component response regulator